MGSFEIDGSRVGHSRKGLSFVEFVGCLCALGGGVALGSFYLGVDMKTMCATVLEQAEIVDPGYFSASDAPTDDAETTANNDDPNPSQSTDLILSSDEAPSIAANNSTSSALAAAIGSASENISLSPEADPAEKSLSAEEFEEPELTEEEKFVATKKYWRGLVQCIQTEVEHRTTTPGKQESWQLFDYLSHRAQGHEQAVESIDALDELGVDPKLLMHAKQVRTWHSAGAQLYRRAVNLLTDSPNDQLTGPFAQSWQSAATQHRMEEKLVRDKHESIASYLEHTYKDGGSVNPEQ